MKNANRLKFELIAFLILSLATAFSACRESEPIDVVGNSPKEKAAAVELIAQSDTLFAKRSENIQKVKDSLQLLRQARVADNGNYQAAWKMAQSDYFVGKYADDDAVRDKAFNEGISAGRAAARMQPDRADGYFWTGACLGGQAKGNILDGAANLPEIRQTMGKVIELQPDYQGGMAYVALAQIELETRGMMGGSAEKAAEYLEKALALDKQNSFTYLYLAQAYFYLNRKPEARKMLDTLYKLPQVPEYRTERRDILEQAKKFETKF